MSRSCECLQTYQFHIVSLQMLVIVNFVIQRSRQRSSRSVGHLNSLCLVCIKFVVNINWQIRCLQLNRFEQFLCAFNDLMRFGHLSHDFCVRFGIIENRLGADIDEGTVHPQVIRYICAHTSLYTHSTLPIKIIELHRRLFVDRITHIWYDYWMGELSPISTFSSCFV